MSLELPYRYITGLPKRAQEEIRRDFEEVSIALGRLPSVFVTVADDGTGDYDSIKEAVEATSQPGTNDEAGTYIWVKPSVDPYSDNGAGQVDVSNRRVIIFATHPARVTILGRAQAWQMDGFVTTTGNGYVEVHGITLTLSGSEDLLNGASGNLEVILYRSSVSGGRGVCGSHLQTRLTIIECEVDTPIFAAGTAAAAGITFYSKDSGFLLRGTSSPPTLTAVDAIQVFGGSMVATGSALTLTNGNGGGNYQFVGVLLLGGVGNGSVVATCDSFVVSGCSTDEDNTAIDFSVTGHTSSDYCGVSFAGNAMSEATITTGLHTRASIHGTYRAVVLGGSEGLAVIQLDMTTSGTGISITGDQNYVVAAIRNGGGTAKAVAISAGADNNRVLYSGTGFGAADTDAGSGNTINTFTPAAHAASHLPGGSDALTTAAAGTIEPDDAAAAGAAASFSRSDHKHAIVAATAATIGSANTEGSATSFSRSDHVHALPGIISAGGPTGSATVVPVITWDAQGRLTVVTTATIALTVTGDVTGSVPGTLTVVNDSHDHTAATLPADTVYDADLILPFVEAGDGAGATLTNNTETLLTYDTNDDGNSGTTLHHTTTNPSRFIASKAGLWRIEVTVGFASNVNGNRRVTLRLNNAGATAGGIVGRSNQGTAPSRSTYTTLVKTLELAASDYLEVTVLQDSGGNLALDNTTRIHGVVFIYCGPAT